MRFNAFIIWFAMVIMIAAYGPFELGENCWQMRTAWVLIMGTSGMLILFWKDLGRWLLP